jgi:hypothetical protein
MTPALPAAISIGTHVTAALTPPRTFRRRPVTVSGRVCDVGPYTVTVKGPGGYFTVRAQDARPS